MNGKLKAQIGTAFIIIVSIVVLLYFKKHFWQTDAFIKSLGVFGPIVSILLYSIVAFTPLPSDPVSVLAVAAFGPIMGMIIIALGNTLAATVEYFFGRTLRVATSAQTYLEKLPFGLAKLPVNSFIFLVGGRLIPGGYGSKIISLLAGMYHVKLWRYVWTTLLTNLIGALMVTAYSYGLFKLL